MIERQLQLLWTANDQLRFDLAAATRGPMLTTQAATLAMLRRLEGAPGDEPGEAASGDHRGFAELGQNAFDGFDAVQNLNQARVVVVE